METIIRRWGKRPWHIQWRDGYPKCTYCGIEICESPSCITSPFNNVDNLKNRSELWCQVPSIYKRPSKLISRSNKGMQKPCFFTKGSHKNGVMPYYAYFWPSNSCHSWTLDNLFKPGHLAYNLACSSRIKLDKTWGNVTSIRRVHSGDKCETINVSYRKINLDEAHHFSKTHIEDQNKKGWRYRPMTSNAAK